jgi:putative flavoprotein involved in K+ transport
VRDGRALFSGGLRNVLALADLKLNRLLDTFDEWARSLRGDADVGSPERLAATHVPDAAWLNVPALDAKGQLRHDGGVVDSPGMYALGLPVLRRRKSTFIHGIEDDARDVIDHLAARLAGRPSQ